MELELWRYSGGADATLGFLMRWRVSTWEFACFICEDEHRNEKVHGETRIPAGRYKLGLRHAGGMSSRYELNYPRTHRGMIQLLDVPGFEWIYIHIGNDDDDTLGCLLTGEERHERSRSVGRSRAAYERIYPEIADAIETVGAWLTVRDCDRMQPPHPPNG